MSEIKTISKNSVENRTKKLLKSIKNMDQVLIKYEKTWKDTEIMESIVTRKYESTPKEQNYNILKHETYDYEQALFNNEDEPVVIKNEITEGIIIKEEPDFIQVENQENTDSEQFSDGNLYYYTELESIAAPCVVNKTEMGENIEINVSFKVERELEEICIKNEITEELIIKDEPDFIQIETQENTDSEQFSDSNSNFSSDAESTDSDGSNENKMGENIEKNVPFKVEKELEDICIKNEITEELIIKHEPDIIQIETQENTDSEQFPDSNSNFSSEAESTDSDVSNENSMCEFQREIVHTNFKPYECDVCNKEFRLKSILKRHRRIHTGKKPYACDVCEKTFNVIGNLIQHKNIHTGERPYACDVCEKSFRLKSNLKKHRPIHSGKKPYACDICEKTFNIKNYLVQHKLIHSKERPNACKICKKTFNRRGDVQNHERIHTGENPYACDICKKTFYRKADLQNHEHIHTGEKPYACDACEKTFCSKNSLIRHKIVHSGKKPFACDICKKTFHRKDLFQKHKRIHTREKPYTCDICEKKFYFKSNLTKHKIIHHTVKRPYACNICKNTFSRKSWFDKHECIHTGENPKHVLPT